MRAGDAAGPAPKEWRHSQCCWLWRPRLICRLLCVTCIFLPAGIGSVGLFLEDRERPSVNIFKQVEKKRLLSTVEKAGLLS